MSENAEKKLRDFVNNLEDNIPLLWLIKLSQSKSAGPYKCQVSIPYLRDKLGVTKRMLATKSCIQQINVINNLLIQEQVILPNYGASVLNMRRRLKLWWCNLSYHKKCSLHIFGNRVQIAKYVDDLRTGKGYELLQQELDHIHDELRELGVIDADYLSVEERNNQKKSNYHAEQSKNKQRVIALGEMTLDSIDDFVSPSENTPFSQWEQLFASASKLVPSSSGRSNYREAFNHVKNYLIQIGISPLSELDESLNEFFLISFKRDYLLTQLSEKRMSPASATTIFSAVRMTLKRATRIKNLSFRGFYDEELKAEGRVGEKYQPYSIKERYQIDHALKNDMAHIISLNAEYQVSGCGENPLNKSMCVINGKATEENARYLFENDLDRKLVFYHTARTPLEKGFISVVSKLDIGLHELYEKWGVLSRVDAQVLAPFLFQLCRITGLNAESAIDLDVDSYLERHPLTQKPCLRYWKERGIGELDMHLDLFNAEITWLPMRQGVMVSDIFETVLALTENIRERAPSEIKNKLFIYQSSGQNTFDDVKVLLPNNTYNLYPWYVKKHGLVNDSGGPMTFTLSRFRPSFVSEMLEDGLSLRDIQVLLGHSSIAITIRYLDRLDFSRISRVRLYDALSELQHNAQFSTRVKKPKKYTSNPQGVIFQTPLSGCANIFEPPEFIKKSKSFKKGQPCSQFNKCLSCENIMISVIHLPMLFALERHYIHMSEVNRVIDTPYGVVILENLSVLQQVLDPKESDFTEQELDFAKKQSYHIDISEVEGMGA